MNKLFYAFCLFLISGVTAVSQPLTGSKYIPGDYTSVKQAISDLNINGVGSGGVIFNITANHKEVFTNPESGHITTTTGSLSSPITFRKDGNGANPLITAAPGVGDMDALFLVAGCDYVTFDGLDIRENSANQDPVSQMEWGFAILKASGADGSQNITIKNCSITLDTNNVASKGIYSNNHTMVSTVDLTVTSVDGTNSGLSFFNNQITNCYNGIYVQGFAAASPYSFYDQNNEIGKDGPNVINHFGGSDMIAYGIYTIYQNNLKVANNTVTSFMGGDKRVYGIYMTNSINASYELYGNTVSIRYNTWDGDNSGLYGIFCDMGANGTSNTAAVYNNTITNCAFPSAASAPFYGIFMNLIPVTASVYGNEVSNNTYGSSSASATGQNRYLWIQKSSTVSGPLTVYGNTVTGNVRTQAVRSTGQTYMLSIVGSGTTLNAYNNTVSNNVISSADAANCLYVTFSDASGKYLNNNIISNITEANGSVNGLYNSGGTIGYIYNNKVQGISSSIYATTATIRGIYHNSGTTMYYYNNMISDLNNPGSVATLGYDYDMMSGFYVENGGNFKGFYNNTVYLNVTALSSEYGSSALCATYLGNVDMKNNLFVNVSTSAGSNAKTMVLHSRNTGFSGFTSNYNDLYAGTPGPSNVIFVNPSATYQTLAQYQAQVNPSESQSVTFLPPFVNVASIPYDLHINPTVPSQCESGGVVITSPPLTSDIDGNPRYPNTGYPVNPSFSPTAPDLGADEVGGLPVDLSPPSITYTPLTDINNGNARTLTATILDNTGVPVSGPGLPVLYWKKNSLNYVSVQGIYTGNNTYSFTFGAGAILNDVISYYIVAEDAVLPFPNVGAFPSQGAAGFSANPPTCTTPPTNPSSYKVISDISGVKHIGVGKDYATLTAAASDLNLKYMSGPVTFLLDDASYPNETFPIRFNDRPGNSSVNNLTVRPNAGASPVISGAGAGQAILLLNGLDYVTIDGSNNGTASKNLTIENTSSSSNSHAIGISNHNGTDPSRYASILNCILRGQKYYDYNFPDSGPYVIVINSGGGLNGGGYDNCLISGNTIEKARIAIFVSASLGNINRNLVISNNMIGSYDTSYCIQRFGIAVAQSDNTLIADNEIMGPTLATPLGNMFGILYYDNCSNTRIHRNKIHDWNSLALGSYGIKCSNDNNATPTEIFNNLIYNISTPGMNEGPANNNAYGIFVRLGSNIKIWHNTINLSGPYLYGIDSFGPSSACICTYTAESSGLDIRDNILRNSMTNPATVPGGNGRAYAIQHSGNAASFTGLEYNDYYVDGYRGTIALTWVPGIGNPQYFATLPEWQGYTGKDVHSLSLNPVFVSEINPLNFHPTNLNLNSNGGPKILDVDLMGAARYNPSDMGSYEWSVLVSSYHTLDATSVSQSDAVLNGDIDTKGEVVQVYFDYGTTSNYGNVATPSPSSVRSVGALQAVSAAVSGLLPNTTYHYRFVGVPETSGQANLYGADMTFTTGTTVPVNITVSNTVTGTQCFNASQTITVAGSPDTFVVTPAGNVTMIAGQNIIFLPGAVVQSGGYLHGYISNQYCGEMDAPMVAAGVGAENHQMGSQSSLLMIYPNPTSGAFTLEFKNNEVMEDGEIELFSMQGDMVYHATLNKAGKHAIDFSNKANGMYFLRVITAGKTETARIVKQ